MRTQNPELEPQITAFMLVRTTPEWLSYPVARRGGLADEHSRPIVKKHQADVALHYSDVEFYSARVTNLWMWQAKDHSTYQLLIEELRESPFWDRYFEIVEFLIGVEDAYAKNYDTIPLNA